MSTNVTGLKACKRCDSVKPVDEFRQHHHVCKNCCREQSRLYYQNNLNKVKGQKHQYRQNNLDKERERGRRYYQNNSDKVGRRTCQYRQNNPDKARGYCCKWRQNNLDKERERGRRRRAREQGAVQDSPAIMAAHEVYLREHQRRCYYCERRFGARLSSTIDHIVPFQRGGPHTVGNTVLACRRCNSSKGAKLLSEWNPPFKIVRRLT